MVEGQRLAERARQALLRFRPGLISAAVILLLFGGGYAAYWRGRTVDAAMRQRLLSQAVAITRTIDVEQARGLTFTASDVENPYFQRLSMQMRAYAQSFGHRSIYSLAIREDALVFGPESLKSDDPFASPVGSRYQEPSDRDWAIFHTGKPYVGGPTADEYGVFVSAVAPVYDPRSGEVLMAIGIDVPADQWRVRIMRAWLLPILTAVTLAAVLLLGDRVLRLRRQLPPQRGIALRYAEVWVTVAFGLVLTSAVAYLAYDAEQRAQQAAFASVAGAQERLASDMLRDIRELQLSGLVHFYLGSEHVTREEFRIYTEPYIRTAAVQTWAWAPYVPLDARGAIEAEARQDGFTDFAIFEFDEYGAPALASEREVYYPILYAEPVDANTAHLGYDLGSDPPIRAALEDAIRTGLATATDPVVLMRRDEIGRSILLLAPVLLRDGFPVPSSAIAGADGQEILGFVFATLPVKAFLDAVVAEAVQQETFVHVDLLQLQEEGPALWWVTSSGDSLSDHGSFDDLVRTSETGLSAIYPLFMFGKAYAIVIHPSPAFLEVNPARAGGLTALTGSLLTASLATVIGLLSSRRAELEQMVQSRTLELQASEGRFRRLAENAQDIIYRVRLYPERGFEYVSPVVFAMTGYTPEEHYADPDLGIKLVHPDDLPLLGAAMRGEMAPGEPLILRWLRKDGSTLWVEQRNVTLYDDEGRPVCIEGIARDVTERHSAEEERERLLKQIQEHAMRVQGIMDAVPQGVLLLDAGGRVLLANPVARRHLDTLGGVAVGEVLDRIGDRSLGEVLTSHADDGLWHEVRMGGSIFEVAAQPMEAGTESGPWVLVISDVTKERETRQLISQQERLAAVGRLSAGIAHDFNNILAAITLYAQLILRHPDAPPELFSHSQVIVEQAGRAAELVRQILDFSRRAMLQRQPLLLLPFLQDTTRLLERILPESITIHLTCDADALTIYADRTRVQQALMNLALNARDAMTDGGELRIALDRVTATGDPSIGIHCVTCGEVEDGDWVRISVSDTGTGMDPEALTHLFEPFFTTKGPGRGSGLGLAQVYGILKQHEGHIDVQSRAGVGTTFWLYWPVVSTNQPVVEPARPTAALGDGQTILIVEDEATVRSALVAAVTMLNYTVLTAANGPEALDLLAERGESVNLVLTDWIMPGQGGADLVQVLQIRYPHIKVLVLTGYPLGARVQERAPANVVGWLSKPPDINRLAEILARALGSEGA